MTNLLRDQLTGLLHRVHGLQLFAQFLAEAEQNYAIVGVTMIDIDRFAYFNYYFGHIDGDELLKKLASLIQSTISSTDVACRFGGDEFLILSPSTSPESVKAQAELLRKQAQAIQIEFSDKIRQEVEQDKRKKVFVGELPDFLSLTLGLAFYPQHGTTSEALIIAADEAVIQGKLSGRNCIAVAQ